MNFTAIDSVYLAAANPAEACRPYEFLGLTVPPNQAGERSLTIGSPANRCSLRFVSPSGNEVRGQAAERALSDGRPLFAVRLRVPDLSVAVKTLGSRGVEAIPFPGGAWLPVQDRAGTNLVLIEEGKGQVTGPCEHRFPLRRLDHLAAVTPDLEVKTRFWVEVLGVAVHGEVITPTLVIRQLKIGDAVLELLGPASADSPIWTRPPGLISMASWEVADLGAVVGLARSSGFTVTEPASGPLPRTRIATIQGSELSGVNMQLLQYEK